MRRTGVITALLLTTTVGVAGVGCSSSGAGGQGPHAGDPASAVLAAARSYQAAFNRRDWKTVCALSTPGMRGGSVAHCVASHVDTGDDAATTAPAPSSAGAGQATPLIDTATPNGPDYAPTGPVSAGNVVTVPAAEDHPAGYGVRVRYTVTWPGKAPETVRWALRMVDQHSRWLVDQSADTLTVDDAGHVAAELATT